MEAPLTIVIAVDGLRAAALGTYGNTTYATPALDRLAASAEVVEWFLAAGPQLEEFYRDIWTPTPRDNAESSVLHPWPAQLVERGSSAWCLSDDQIVVSQAKEAGFSHSALISTTSEPRPVTDVAETSQAQFFTGCIEQLAAWRKASTPKGGLLWLHSRGLTGAWDAPLHLRQSLLDEEDPEPAFPSQPPESMLIADSEEAFAWQISYAAQIAVLDKCLESYFASIAELCPLDQVNLLLLGTRGFSLGEHQKGGYDCASLFSEQLHLPCLFARELREEPLQRTGGLHQPADLGSALFRWMESREWKLSGHPCAVAVSDFQKMARTSEWMLLTQIDNSGDQLFAKPDDRWEMNDVASRCPEIVEQLKEIFKAGIPAT